MKLKIHAVRFSKFACFGLLTGMLFSCGPTKPLDTNYLYFRDGAKTVAIQNKETVIRPGDAIGIQVYSKTLNQEQAAIFNGPGSGSGTSTASIPGIGSVASGASSSGAGQQGQSYHVAEDGTVEMPVLGSIPAGGLTKYQLQDLLVQKLGSYVKNPGVNVRFLQFTVSLLGEVKSPGVRKFDTDKVTVIEALAAAGDLTDFGKREDVTVIREEQGKKVYHTLDLRDKAVFQSPVYQLQPNDIIYVAPNLTKLKILNVDPEAQRRTTLIFSVTGIVLSIATLIITIIR